MNRSLLLLPLLLLAALCGARDAAATVMHCVDTGIELQNAFNAAGGNGQDDEIRIAAVKIMGSPAVPGATRWALSNSADDETTAVIITGGWSPASTCTSQSSDPTATELDAQELGPALHIQTIGSPTVVLRNLTIARGSSDFLPGAGLRYEGSGAGSSFTMDHVLLLANENTYFSKSIAHIVQHNAGKVTLSNNLFAFNQGLTTSSTTVLFGCDPGALCYFNSNSIHDNYTSDQAYLTALGLSGEIVASNNAVGNNASGSAAGGLPQVGSWGTSTKVSVRNNHFESRSFSALFQDLGTTTGDPKWTQQGLYRTPNAQSPLRDSGLNNVLGGVGSTDVAGHTRIQDGTIDRGAIESAPLPNQAPQLTAPTSRVVSYAAGNNYGVYKVSASDDGKPSPLSYSLPAFSCSPATNQSLFSIDALQIVRQAALVPQGTLYCDITVKVFDGHYSDTAVTRVTYNYPPKFTPQNVDIDLPTATPVGALTWQAVALDDGVAPGPLVYNLYSAVSPPGLPNPFAVASDGKVTLSQTLPSEGGEYQVNIRACDVMGLCAYAYFAVHAIAPPPLEPAVFHDGFDN